MFENISEIVQLSRENGYSFFSKERQRQYKTRVLPTIYCGRYFITESVIQGKKMFSIYKALKDGACDIVQEEVYLSERSAKRHINLYFDHEEEQSEEVSYELR